MDIEKIREKTDFICTDNEGRIFMLIIESNNTNNVACKFYNKFDKLVIDYASLVEAGKKEKLLSPRNIKITWHVDEKNSVSQKKIWKRAYELKNNKDKLEEMDTKIIKERLRQYFID